ncbi:hypothetical protein Tco_0712200 [Tanacetum coccineum]
MKEPVPRDLSPTPFLGHLKKQMGSPYRTRKTIRMIGNPEEIHNTKAQEDEGDMDVGWDITCKDVERLMQFLTPTIHTRPYLEPVVQPYIPLGPVHDKDKIVREKEQDYDIPLNDSVCSLEALTGLNLCTWATKWFKRLVAYAKCNRDSYESELGDKELAGRRR